MRTLHQATDGGETPAVPDPAACGRMAVTTFLDLMRTEPEPIRGRAVLQLLCHHELVSEVFPTEAKSIFREIRDVCRAYIAKRRLAAPGSGPAGDLPAPA